MAGNKSLKARNYPSLIGFVVWLLFFLITFLTFSDQKVFQFAKYFLETEKAKLLYIVIFPFLIIVLNGILPSNAKAVLVFHRFKNVLPGHRIFTKLVNKDPRIDTNRLFNLIGYKPILPSDQNKTWYSIYKKFESMPFISESHRVFLLTRDLTAISFLFIPIGLLVLIFNNLSADIILKFTLISIIQYFIIAYVASNYGKRFALNVLAEYSSN